MELTKVSDDGSGKSSGPSWIDKWTGRHTSSVIVAILILILLMAIVLLVIYGDDKATAVTGRLLDAIYILVGFFAGTGLSRGDKD